MASKETLQRLKREPQFIDQIFAAKTERTKMEEEPAMAVPDTEQDQEFMIEQKSRNEEGGMRNENTSAADSSLQNNPPQGNLTPHSTLHIPQDDDFDLSDLSVKPKEKTREDIIAEAEAAAFAEAEG